MSVINTIKDEINSTGYSVDWIIQHSYNPRSNDAIHFLVYSDNQISHIVSTYRNPVDSWKRLHDQNDLMQSVLKKVQNTPLKENVLFSTWLLDLPQGCFRIQEFRKKEFYLQVSKLNLTDLHRYLDISCAWIIDFQKVTTYGSKPVHQLAIRETIKHAKDNGIILFDSPPGTSCPVVATVSKADFVIMVTEPSPFGLHDLQLMVETVKQLGKKHGIIVNKAGLNYNPLYDYINKYSIPLIGEIPFRKELAGAYSKGEIIAETSEELKNIFTGIIHKIISGKTV